MAKANQPPMSRALARRETISGYLFMLPSLLFFFVFVVYPMVMCVFTSLTDATMADAGGNFIGITNYVNLFQDEIFRKALVNTVIIVVVSVPTVCAFSLWVGARIYKMKDWACHQKERKNHAEIKDDYDCTFPVCLTVPVLPALRTCV